MINHLKILILIVAHLWLIGASGFILLRQNLAVFGVMLFPLICLMAGVILELAAFFPKRESLVSVERRVNAIRILSKVAMTVVALYCIGFLGLFALIFLNDMAGEVSISNWLGIGFLGLLGFVVYFYSLFRFVRRL